MRFLLGVLMLMISGSALATIDVLQFKDEAQEQQFRQLTEELRCPKCQNNSIADSNSMIATDLRQKVYELMQEGKSKKEIVDYMVARYGNFVTYDPPLTPLTVLLWVLPVVAIGIGGWETLPAPYPYLPEYTPVRGVGYAWCRKRFQNKACRKVSVPDMLFICRVLWWR
ncbi:hypothetical protein EIMP300_39180 [Escherichia coli]|uniref:Cytochrome c-type biogenesis protein n=1 Tax=Escherichia coli TaxID=562 RepID=A0A8S0FQS6_ECOLX|nr:hypothetical protein EIMP300_39180 [Escherichia coli]